MAKKKANGAGTVKKLPSGTWRGQIMDGYRADGKKNIVSFTAPTKGEVQTMIRNYWFGREEQVTTGPEETLTPFDAWADAWYADYKSQVQPSTYCNYQYTLRVLKDYFGDTPIERIKPIDVNQFHDFLISSPMSKSYVTKCRAMLIQIFDAAEVNSIVNINAARKSKVIRITKNYWDEDESKKDAFSDIELDLLRKYLPDNMIGHTILVMLSTGVRSQEILALLPEDIADDGSSITISKAIKMVDGVPCLGTTKSKKSRRVVPVPDDYREDALYLKHNAGKPYVWTSKRENGLYDVGAFRRRYYSAIKKIPGIRPLSPHCCRHTYISNLEKRGVPMEQIARLAGHSRITTTDGYVHTDLSTLANAVSVLNGSRTTQEDN